MDYESRRDIEAGFHKMELRLMNMESKMHDRFIKTEGRIREGFHETNLKFIRMNSKLENTGMNMTGALVILGIIFVFSIIYIAILK